MKITETTQAPGAIGPYSQAISVGNLLFASGQIALDPCTGTVAGETIEQQAEQVMKNVSAILKANGIGFEQAVKTTCYLTNMADFAAFNEIYGRYFTGKPARSCVAVKGLPKGALCEVEVVAELS